MNDVNSILADTKAHMKKAIDHLEFELSRIRAGKASPEMLSGVKVDYYGVMTPIEQAANINTTDAKTLIVKPWDKNMLEPIEKAIMAANLGFTPQNDGELIRIVLPALTEERRQELVKAVKQEAEQARISIRNIRRDAMQHLKKLLDEGLSEDMEKKAENEIQQMTDKYTDLVEKHVDAKEKEMTKV
jgi:ribosome recycling factor